MDNRINNGGKGLCFSRFMYSKQNKTPLILDYG